MLEVKSENLNNILKLFAVGIQSRNCLEGMKPLIIFLGQTLKNDLKVYEALKKLNRLFEFDKLFCEDSQLINLLSFQMDSLIA